MPTLPECVLLPCPIILVTILSFKDLPKLYAFYYYYYYYFKLLVSLGEKSDDVIPTESPLISPFIQKYCSFSFLLWFLDERLVVMTLCFLFDRIFLMMSNDIPYMNLNGPECKNSRIKCLLPRNFYFIFNQWSLRETTSSIWHSQRIGKLKISCNCSALMVFLTETDMSKMNYKLD